MVGRDRAVSLAGVRLNPSASSTRNVAAPVFDSGLAALRLDVSLRC
jgi:hypothetical protein